MNRITKVLQKVKPKNGFTECKEANNNIKNKLSQSQKSTSSLRTKESSIFSSEHVINIMRSSRSVLTNGAWSKPSNVQAEETRNVFGRSRSKSSGFNVESVNIVQKLTEKYGEVATSFILR